jgi:hypothetical protein
MSNKQERKAYFTLLQMSHWLQSQGSYERTIIQERWTSSTNYSRAKTGHTTQTMKNFNFVSISEKLPELTAKTTLFLLNRIRPAICMYNSIFWYEPRTGTQREIVKELIDKRVMMRTEVTHLYLLNPMMIFRGTPKGAIMATLNAIQNNGGTPDRTLIHDLRPNDDHTLQLDNPFEESIPVAT